MQRKYADGSLKLAGHLRMLSTSEIQAKDASGQRCQCDPFYKLHHDAEKQENVSRLQWILSDNPSEQLLTKRSKKRGKDKDQLRLPRNFSDPSCLSLNSLKHNSIVRLALQEALQDRADDQLGPFLEAAFEQEEEE